MFATTEVSDKGEPNLIFDASGLKAMGAHAGNGLFPTDPNDAIRQMDYAIQGLKSLAIQSAEVATGKRMTTARDRRAETAVELPQGPPGTGRHLLLPRPEGQGLLERVHRQDRRRRRAAPSLQDIHPTSTGSNMPGPEIQANAIETALEGFPLRSIGTVWDVVLIICLGFVVPLASLRTRPMIAVATGLLFAAIFIPGVLSARSARARSRRSSIRCRR